MKNINIKDMLFSISLANLFFIKLWNEILFQYKVPLWRYKVPHAITLLDYGAAILNVMLLFIVIYCGCYTIRNSSNKTIGSICKFAIYIVVIATVFRTIQSILPRSIANIITGIKYLVFNRSITAIIIILIVFVCTYLIIRWRYFKSINKAAILFFIVLSPFCLLTIVQSFYFAFTNKYHDEFQEQPSSQISTISPTKRVVILLFDETDYRLTFEDRPKWITLPEFDKFKESALSANRATSPASYTFMSIPALLTGKTMESIKAVSANNIVFTDNHSSELVSWSQAPTMFSDVRKLGGNSGLAGVYHPYQRILKHDLAFCYVYYSDNISSNMYTKSMISKMINQYKSNLPNNNELLKVYPSIIADSIKMATNPLLQVVFIHYPFPHPPYVYNMNRKKIEVMSLNPINYFSNLALADKTFGELRKAMEQSRMWDESMVIVTSDHWWRSSKTFDGKEDHRIPFIVKLPNQIDGYVYKKKINTVVMRGMISAFFNNKFSQTQDLASWLDIYGQAIDPVIQDEE